MLLCTGWTIDVCTISLFLHLPFTLPLLFTPPPLFFFYKNSISDSCTGWEKCDALPTARSVIASEPQWGPKTPPGSVINIWKSGCISGCGSCSCRLMMLLTCSLSGNKERLVAPLLSVPHCTQSLKEALICVSA